MPQTPQSPDPDGQKNAQPTEADGNPVADSASAAADLASSGTGKPVSGGDAGVTSGAAADAGTKPATGTASATPVTLQDLLDSSQKTATLQQSLKTSYQALPAVLQIAGEILKKRDEGDQALAQGMKVVENVLQETIDKAEALSANLIKHTDMLKETLQDKDALADLLKSGASVQSLKPVGQPATGLPMGLAGGLADPKVAYQLNLLMGNVQSMVSREVENQLSQLREQAEKAMQQRK